MEKTLRRRESRFMSITRIVPLKAQDCFSSEFPALRHPNYGEKGQKNVVKRRRFFDNKAVNHCSVVKSECGSPTMAPRAVRMVHPSIAPLADALRRSKTRRRHIGLEAKRCHCVL